MTVLSQSQFPLSGQAMQEEQWKAFEDIVLLIEFVRRCQTPEEYYLVQQQLEEHIDRVDEAAEDAKQHKAEREQAFYYRLGHQYRTVGDALAWQAYAFQALPLYALGRNQFPGYRTRFKRIGFEEEKKRINELWEKQGAFALHHDCTNCLRIGDLSIFYPDRLTLPEIDEVKVVGRGVASSQKRRLEMAADLARDHYSLREKQHDLLHQTHISPAITHVEQTNLCLLWQALLQARENGIGFAANAYLAITVTDPLRRAGHQDQLAQERLQTTKKMLFPDIWPSYCTDELVSDSWERMARPNLGVPYTIYPLPSDYVAALVTGIIRVHYRLNTDAITQTLREAGFEVECLLGQWRQLGKQPPRKAKPPYFRVHGRGMVMNLGDLPIRQMWFEGLRLEDFVESVKTYFAEQIWNKLPVSESVSHRRTLHMFATYTNMEAIWASSRDYLLPVTEKTA